MAELPFHPLANLFPLIEGEEFDTLADDVRKNGLTDKIVLLDGQILDGRNRYRAALAVGLFEDTEDPLSGFYFANLAEGVDPLTFVLSKNLHRRHLTDDQRRMIAARIVTMGRGRPGDNAANGGIKSPVKRADAAEMLSTDDAGTERARSVVTKGIAELQEAVDSGRATVRAAAEIARLSPEQQRAVIAEVAKSPDTKKAFRDVAREVRGGEVNGARSIMGSRQEPDDSLDYFPTPPWATRALIEVVLPHIGVRHLGAVWEPACGEGHMSGVLEEYPDRIGTVVASDIHDYSADGRMPPAWWGPFDFLDPHAAEDGMAEVDWIVSNPPFGDLSAKFVLRALDLAHVGVAMFFRLQWLDTIGRYETIFEPHPPTVMAQFAERVPLHKGRWEPDGSTATAYLWIVWLKDQELVGRTEFVWIPPGQREGLSLADDVERFTAHPVLPVVPSDDPDTGGIIEHAAHGQGDPAAHPATEDGSGDDAEANADDRRNTGGDHVDEPEAPSTTGLETGAGEGALPVDPAPDLDVPDSLRRVEMTDDEWRRIVDFADDGKHLSLNDRLFIRKLTENPGGMTELDRRHLAKIAAKQSEAVAA